MTEFLTQIFKELNSKIDTVSVFYLLRIQDIGRKIGCKINEHRTIFISDACRSDKVCPVSIDRILADHQHDRSALRCTPLKHLPLLDRDIRYIIDDNERMRRTLLLKVFPLVDLTLGAVLFRDRADCLFANIFQRQIFLFEVIHIQNGDLEVIEPRRDFTDPIDHVIICINGIFERNDIIALIDEFARKGKFSSEEPEKRDKKSQRQKACDIYDQFGLVHIIPYLMILTIVY